MTFLWIFLPIVFLLSLVIDKKYQNVFLVIASLLFYAWGEPVYVLLMILSIILNYGIGIWIENANKRKKGILFCGIVLNIGMLAYFKYYNFFVDNINHLFRRELISTNELALPIGISFFTFQALSYIIDLYRGKYKAQKNIINMALYISFFPQSSPNLCVNSLKHI